MQRKRKARSQPQKGTFQFKKVKMDMGGWARKSERVGRGLFLPGPPLL